MRVSLSPITRQLGALAVVAGLAIAPVAAQAGTQYDSNREYRSAKVYYNDLNLDSEAGQKTFERRIQSAARKVCGPTPRLNLRDRTDYQQCMGEALDSGNKAMVEVIAAVQSGEKLAFNGVLSIGN
ncbi:MAG: UrcA family protein [Pseudomonadota bacterium]